VRRLSQSLALAESMGQPLPAFNTKLENARVVPRRGWTHLLVGQPGAGKSLFALHYVVHQNIPTLYFSADTDEQTMSYRAAAMLTGDKVDQVERACLNGGVAYYEEVLERLDNVRFVFDSAPSLDDIDLEIGAFEEAWGCPPDLIVVDNLMNVLAEHDNEFAGMRMVMQAIHHLSRVTQAAIFVLHHTSEAAGNPHDPPARRDIQGKVSQLPELILGMAANSFTGEYKVACLKNRSGPYDPTGGTYEVLYADFSRMSIHESMGEVIGQADWP